MNQCYTALARCAQLGSQRFCRRRLLDGIEYGCLEFEAGKPVAALPPISSNHRPTIQCGILKRART